MCLLNNKLSFRISNHEFGAVLPKYSQSRGKYGKLHASKEKLWTQMHPFILPKGSPIYVSKIDNFLFT